MRSQVSAGSTAERGGSLDITIPRFRCDLLQPVYSISGDVWLPHLSSLSNLAVAEGEDTQSISVTGTPIFCNH